jgi:hypothetical protein
MRVFFDHADAQISMVFSRRLEPGWNEVDDVVAESMLACGLVKAEAPSGATEPATGEKVHVAAAKPFEQAGPPLTNDEAAEAATLQEGVKDVQAENSGNTRSRRGR